MLKNILVGAALSACIGLAGAAQAQDNYALDYVAQQPGAPTQTYGAPVYGDAGMAATPWSTYEQVVPSLDYNYYYPTPGGYTTSARLYQSPRPVPLHVGYTYITYQPFAPHNYLYGHRTAYITNHPSGTTITRVRWGTGLYNHLKYH